MGEVLDRIIDYVKDEANLGKIEFLNDPICTQENTVQLIKMIRALDKKLAQVILEIEIIKNTIERNGRNLKGVDNG